MSASATAPPVNKLDISNYATPTGNDKWFIENSAAGAAKGQTFTTGTLPTVLKAVTYQVTASQKAASTKAYKIRVGTISGNTFTEIHSETASQTFLWNGGEYMTWTFATPVALLPSTLYGVDVGMTSSTSSWQTGIPYINFSGNTYASGQLYNSGTNGLGTSTVTFTSGSDRTFHLDLQHPMDPSPSIGATVPAGSLTLSWTNLTPTTGSDVWVDVWFGTNAGALTKVADKQQNLSSFVVNLPGANTYYWRIDSYVNGAPSGSPVQSTVFNFTVTDSDADGFPDAYELANTSPPSATTLNVGDDLDNDGLTNWQEYQRGTSPTNPDTDGDTLQDGPELTGVGSRSATDPTKADTDGDGLSDGVESNTGIWIGRNDTGTDPTNIDSDRDALTDTVETNTGIYVSKANTGTSPLLADTDNDGVGDWNEITSSLTNPFLASDKPGVPYPLPDPDNSTGITNKPVKVYIMSGQSNMVGFGTRDGTSDSTLQTMTLRENKFPNLINSGGAWTTRQDVRYRGVISDIAKVALSPANLGSSFGPELGFGYMMGWYHDEPVLLLKSSIGNRSLGWDILPHGSLGYQYGGKEYAAYGQSVLSWNIGSPAPAPWAPGSWYAGKEFDRFFKHESDWVNPDTPDFNVVDVLDNFATEYPDWAAQGFEIAGFVWWQGDKDRYDLGHATRYKHNLVNLINSLRGYYATRYPGKIANNAPFVLATLGQTPLTSTDAAEKPILDAMLAVDGESGDFPQFKGNVKTVYAHPLSEGGASNSHYNLRAGTYMLVGDALGRAMVSLQSATASNTFANWISGFTSIPSHLSGFNHDADGDGIVNGLEYFMGTNPGSVSAGLSSGIKNANTFTFTHPQNAAATSDLITTYRWSKDLFTFYNGGQTDADGTTVNFSPVTIAGMTTVTATVTGTPTAKLFVDLHATQK